MTCIHPLYHKTMFVSFSNNKTCATSGAGTTIPGTGVHLWLLYTFMPLNLQQCLFYHGCLFVVLFSLDRCIICPSLIYDFYHLFDIFMISLSYQIRLQFQARILRTRCGLKKMVHISTEHIKFIQVSIVVLYYSGMYLL